MKAPAVKNKNEFIKFIEDLKANLQRKVPSPVLNSGDNLKKSQTLSPVIKTQNPPDQANEEDSLVFDDFSPNADDPVVFDDFSIDDDNADAAESASPGKKFSSASEQALIDRLSSFIGQPADLWMAETAEELLFAVSLLYDCPKDNFIPRREENDRAAAFLFYHDDSGNVPMVAVMEGDQFHIRPCIRQSWEEELYSKDHEKKIILLPSRVLGEGKLVLFCRIRSDITAIDETQLNIFLPFADFLSGRQVLFISSDPSAMLSLKENKWWDRFAETGRFHIVLCNLRNISVGEYDSSSPIDGALKNFTRQRECFYPGAWRHAVL